MSRVDTSSSGDESISPVASLQPTGSKPLRDHEIEPQAPARGCPPKRPGICSPSPARTQADSPASSYRSTRPAFPPIEKWTVASLRQALANSDIQAPRKSTKAELYELYKNPKPTTLSTKTTTKATRKRKHTASPRWTPPSSSRSKNSSRRAPDSGTRPSASLGHAPDFADARPTEGPAAAQPYGMAFQSAMPVPITQTGFWPPPPPVLAQQPTPFCPEPAAQVNAWPQWPAYVAPQPGPGPVAQASTLLQWPSNPIPQPTPLSSGPITQVDTGPHGPLNTAPPAAYNTLLQAKPQYSLFTATPMTVPANAIATEPPQAAHNVRAQILAGADVDLSSLLSLLPTSDLNRQIDCGDFSVTLKNPNPLSSRILSFPEFSIAFSRFTEIICSVFPHRRRELNDYLAIISDKDFCEYLLSGLRYGFNPGVECALSQSHICNNLQSAHAEPAVVNELIEKEVKSGFMIGPFERSQVRLHDRTFRRTPFRSLSHQPHWHSHRKIFRQKTANRRLVFSPQFHSPQY